MKILVEWLNQYHTSDTVEDFFLIIQVYEEIIKSLKVLFLKRSKLFFTKFKYSSVPTKFWLGSPGLP